MSARKRRPGLFACIGLDLLGHPKANAAGAAMLTWFWATLHSRKHHRDGFISDVDIENLPKPSNRRALAERLAEPDVDLFERAEGGWKILKFEEWNETKTEIDARREATRARVEKHRNTTGNALQPALHAQSERITDVPSNANVPDSDSVLVVSPSEASAPEARRDDGVFGMSGDAYGNGIRMVTNKPFAPLTRFDTQDLQRMIAAHGGGLRGQPLLDWVTKTAAEFATAKPYLSLTPAKCTQWLDAGRATLRPAGSPAREPPKRGTIPAIRRPANPEAAGEQESGIMKVADRHIAKAGGQ